MILKTHPLASIAHAKSSTDLIRQNLGTLVFSTLQIAAGYADQDVQTEPLTVEPDF